jgi:hypothetical protein
MPKIYTFFKIKILKERPVKKKKFAKIKYIIQTWIITVIEKRKKKAL